MENLLCKRAKCSEQPGGEAVKIDLAAERRVAGNDCYFQLDTNCTDYVKWDLISAEEAFASDGELIIARSEDDALEQALAKMPPTSKPGYSWIGNVKRNKGIVVEKIECLDSIGSLEELVATLPELGKLAILETASIGGQRLTDLDWRGAGIAIDTIFYDTLGCYVWFVKRRFKCAAPDLRGYVPRTTVIDDVKDAIRKSVPLNMTTLRDLDSVPDQVVALDVAIMLYNAYHGPRSHRRLRAFQSLLAAWPNLKEKTPELNNKKRKSAPMVAWLDAEYKIAKKKPVPEDQLIDVTERPKKMAAFAYCNPGYQHEPVKGKTTEKTVSRKAAPAKGAKQCTLT